MVAATPPLEPDHRGRRRPGGRLWNGRAGRVLKCMIAFASILTLLAIGQTIYAIAFHFERRHLVLEATQRLDFYVEVLTRDLNRIADLSYLLGHDAELGEALRSDQPANARDYLRHIAVELDLVAIAIYGDAGVLWASYTPSASPDILAASFMLDRMIVDALLGSSSSRFAPIGSDRLPVSLTASSIHRTGQRPVGATVFAVDLSHVVESWDRVGEMVFLTDSAGVITLSSNPAWQGMTTNPEVDQSIARFPIERLRDGEINFMNDRYDLIGTPVEISGGNLYLIVQQDGARNYAESILLLFGSIGLGFVVLILLTRGFRLNRALQTSRAAADALQSLNRELNREITERQATEERLSRAQGELERASRLAALGLFASAVTHELGQPITAMHSYLIAAEHRAGENPPAHLPQLKALVLRMQKIAEDLKHFSRRPSELNQAVSAGAIMRGALALLDNNLKEADVRVDLAIGSEPVLILGDALRLEQAVTNIVRNAIDAMQGQELRHLDLHVSARDGTVRIEIRDTGPGLGGRELNQLSEPFFSASRTGQGMGLGLSIAGDIVREHGGALKAADRSSGGAVFEIILPRHGAEGMDS